jgi:hypothetical protein
LIKKSTKQHQLIMDTKRLFSYFPYIYLAITAVGACMLLYRTNQYSSLSWETIRNNTTTLVFIVGPLVFILIKYKRIYADSSNLYIFGLLSRKCTVISKSDIYSVEKMLPWLPLIYIIKYETDYERKWILLHRNFFIPNIKKYISIPENNTVD